MYSIDLSEEATQFFEAASAKLQQCLDRAFELQPIIEKLQAGDFVGDRTCWNWLYSFQITSS